MSSDASADPSRPEMSPEEAADLDAVVAQMKANLKPEFTRLQREEKLSKAKTIRFSPLTLELLERLARHFDTSEAEVVRALCSGYRLEFDVARETVEEFSLLIGRFAGAFSSEEMSLEQSRQLASELRRQARAVYRDFREGRAPRRAALQALREEKGGEG